MWTGIPNLRHLRAFSCVLRCGGVTKAAREIHLSQPALTQALAKLQQKLGVKLLEAGAKGLEPTEIGRQFGRRVDRAFDFIAVGARAAQRGEGRRLSGGFAHFEHLVSVVQLRALAAVAKTRNFSLAARELGLSQPSVHRAARDVERLIGAYLFEASRQGVDLTPTAKAFARHAALAHSELLQGLAEVSASLSRDPGVIVVGAMPFARTKLLPEAMNRLSRDLPHAHVRVISAPYDDLLDHLRHGAIDFLLGALRAPTPIEDVVQEPLFEDPLSVVARAGHPLVGRNDVSHADLLAFPWAVPGAETPTRAVFRQLFSSQDQALMPGGMIETSSLVLLRGVLAGGDRLTIISARQADYEIAQGRLAVVAFPIPFGARQIGMTFRHD